MSYLILNLYHFGDMLTDQESIDDEARVKKSE